VFFSEHKTNNIKNKKLKQTNASAHEFRSKSKIRGGKNMGNG